METLGPVPVLNPVVVETAHYSAIRASDPSLQNRVFALRYQAYRRVEAIPANADERFSDALDRQPNTMSYLLEQDERLVGSIRASLYRPDSGHALPCFQHFQQEVAAGIGLDQRIVESSRFATVDPSYDLSLDLQFQLFRLIAANAIVHQADWVVTTVRPKHLRIYHRFFGMEPLSEAKVYGDLNGTLGVLCGMPFGERFPAICQRQPRVAITLAEARNLAI